MINHENKSIPKFPEAFGPDDTEYVWFCWEDYSRGVPIVASTFVLPAGWTNNGDVMDVPAVDDTGEQFDNCCGVLLSTTHTEGTHIISNQVTLQNGRIFARSVKLKIKTL